MSIATADLIARAQQGQESAFDALIDAYAQRLFGYLYRLTASRHEAEDLLQDLFVRLVGAIKTYEHQDNFDAFVFRIATNLYRDRLRRRRRAGTTLSLDEPFDELDGRAPVQIADPAEARVDADMEHSEARDRLQLALAELPEVEREVIVLRHYSSMSFKEIAAAMGTPLGTALARAHRGLIKLRSQVEG